MLKWIRALDRVLKGEATRPAALRAGTIDLPLGGLAAVIFVLAVVYGACMGSSAVVTRWESPTVQEGYKQLAFSAAKVPMLLFLTLLVTFPSLYVFNALVGSRLGFGAVLRLLIAAMGVMAAVLASFGTIVVFFSLSTTSYAFMVLLNVVMFAVAGFLGVGFLLQTLHRLTAARAAAALEEAAREINAGVASDQGEAAPDQAYPPPLPQDVGALERLTGQAETKNVRTVFRVWVLVFGLVGAQMGWVLRPFIGDPSKPATFFREREGNFFQAVTSKIGEVMGIEPKRWEPDRYQDRNQQKPPTTQPK